MVSIVQPPSKRCRHTADETFRRLRETAMAYGFTLLSTTWQGVGAKYRFRCKRGHEILRDGTTMRVGKGQCRQCIRDEMAQRFFDSLTQSGYTCLEAGFLGRQVPHRLTCSHGHAWTTRARKILDGHGCPQCARQRFDGLPPLQQTALTRGGLCLAERYEGMAAYYEWACSQGHHWRAVGSAVLQGSWCPHCSDARRSQRRLQRDGLERLQAIATSHGGQCLDEVYAGMKARYRFRCAKGHTWQTMGRAIGKGHWCQRCQSDATRDDLARMQAIAEARGGRCLSDEYVNQRTKLQWQCHRGHVWFTAPTHIVSGHWCMECHYLDWSRRAASRERHSVSTKGCDQRA
jgi:hypothetical protein